LNVVVNDFWQEGGRDEQSGVDKGHEEWLDLAIEHGAFTWQMAIAGSLIEDHGNFLAIWKQQTDASWKLAQNIWNSTLPVPAIA
jgi:hypothetical protein